MRITEITVFEYEPVWVHGALSMSRGRSAAVLRSLVVRVRTDDGIDGWAETCPNGRTYLPSFVEGERAALELLAAALLGHDPRDLGRVNRVMDDVVQGSRAAKGALDTACWDVFGRSVGLPVSQLWGGVTADVIPLFVAVPVGSPGSVAAHVAREVADGVRVFQVKVGDEPLADAARVRAVLDAAGPTATVIADANGGWNLSSALVAAGQLEGLPVRLEQPCATMSDCAELRRHTSLPLILDEVVVTIDDLVQAKTRVGAGGINLKPSRVGGLTRARAMRDTAQGLGMTFTVDDPWGGSLTTAANAQLAATSDPAALTAMTWFADWVRPLVADVPRGAGAGLATAPGSPGLGVLVDVDSLPPPVLHIAAGS